MSDIKSRDSCWWN